MDDLTQIARSPLRAVDWRENTAALLAAELKYPSPRRYDEKTRFFVEYLTQRTREESNQRRQPKRPERFASLDAACQLHESGASGLRYAIEAHLLTDRALDEIAAAVGTTVEVITWYSDLFFDVRDRLQAPHFIVHEVLERCRLRSPNDWRDSGWKSIAYVAGGATLDAAMGIGRTENRQQWLELIQAQSQVIVNDKLFRTLMDATADNPVALWKSAQLELATAKTRTNDVPTAVEANIQACLDFLNFDVGKPRDGKAGVDQLLGAVELRADEQVRVARGETLENHDELSALRIPEPRLSDENPLSTS